MKNNFPRVRDFKGDPGDALEHGGILLPHTILYVYQHCDKFLSRLTLIMHFRKIIAAKILLSSNPAVMIMDKLTRLFNNSIYDHVTVLQSVIVIWKWHNLMFF
jgi:hypothetical protein